MAPTFIPAHPSHSRVQTLRCALAGQGGRWFSRPPVWAATSALRCKHPAPLNTKDPTQAKARWAGTLPVPSFAVSGLMEGKPCMPRKLLANAAENCRRISHQTLPYHSEAPLSRNAGQRTPQRSRRRSRSAARRPARAPDSGMQPTGTPVPAAQRSARARPPGGKSRKGTPFLVSAVSGGGKKLDHFSPRRTPGWSLLPLWGNSPPVRGEKSLSRSDVWNGTSP